MLRAPSADRTPASRSQDSPGGLCGGAERGDARSSPCATERPPNATTTAGSAADIATLLDRRRALTLFAGAGLAALVGLWRRRRVHLGGVHDRLVDDGSSSSRRARPRPATTAAAAGTGSVRSRSGGDGRSVPGGRIERPGRPRRERRRAERHHDEHRRRRAAWRRACRWRSSSRSSTQRRLPALRRRGRVPLALRPRGPLLHVLRRRHR